MNNNYIAGANLIQESEHTLQRTLRSLELVACRHEDSCYQEALALLREGLQKSLPSSVVLRDIQSKR